MLSSKSRRLSGRGATIRISQLSRACDVPVATIKYYLREGLLPPGERTAVNQATYGEQHVDRLRLIRLLREVAGLGIAMIKDILDAASDEGLPVHELLGHAHRALGPCDPSPTDMQLTHARRDVDGFLEQLGWRVSREAPARMALAQALASLRRLGQPVGPEVFAEYAEVADRIAEWEVAHVASAETRERQVEQVVAGTIIYETALLALRRLAQEHHSAQRFADPAT